MVRANIIVVVDRIGAVTRFARSFPKVCGGLRLRTSPSPFDAKSTSLGLSRLTSLAWCVLDKGLAATGQLRSDPGLEVAVRY